MKTLGHTWQTCQKYDSTLSQFKKMHYYTTEKLKKLKFFFFLHWK